ncbi:MAG: hypothetical protein MJB14_03220, partial [Spirochaetes bacterium]|nr:hypothetical protein [Spirochaetota bacterium]
YSYNFDGAGWSSPNAEWREVRFYNLEEGYHTFMVKALHNSMESDTKAITFFVDINKPAFAADKIAIEKLYDEKDVFYAVNIVGTAGAIADISLREVYINDQAIDFSSDGSFAAYHIPLTKDGINQIELVAYDKVGNYTEYQVEVDNPITTILYPQYDNVRFSPLTLVGKINEEISAGMELYLFDPTCEDQGAGNYSGWKKARINEDKTFFVEDVYVNPGSAEKEIKTTLKIKSVFETGKEFEREFIVEANNILMPIELTLSNHAAEGENADTYVKISCVANVDNISSWSVDYDGDGIYDTIDMVDNPELAESKVHEWEHKYSSLGLVSPRVRVITRDGIFFSVTDTLIIHEKIKEASNKMINAPKSLSTVSLEDKSKKVFVLMNDGENDFIEVYNIGRHDTYISNKVFEINLSDMNINNPVVVRALNKDRLFVGANNESTSQGIIYELAANEFGNYIIAESVECDDFINDLTLDEYNLYISYEQQNYLTKIPLLAVENQTNLLDTANKTNVTPDIYNTVGLNSNLGITKDPMGLLIADYFNQRIIRLSNGMNMLEQFGNFGVEEKEFLKPAIIKSYENRIFVFDEERKDIQVFDLNYLPVCTLKYDTAPDYHNYLAPEFFNNIADVDIITKEEGNLLYYYALILSESTGKLAMLRLPQWEELRARVRNNKIVFIQDGEIFTSKPDGGDLKKILSSDSIPRIEGTLDYPALSPDGKTLVFTSRIKLYNGQVDATGQTNDHAYDNIYYVDIETQELVQMNLGSLNGYEIERPVFNSNGDKIVFSAKTSDSKWQIYNYEFKTGFVTKVFDSEENARFPYYSPDDRFIVFTTDYDGDEEIELIDTENTSMRVQVTANYARDSLPVWSSVYPFELQNMADKKVESKIAFVSERNNHKGVYYVYISHQSESDLRVIYATKQSNDQDVGNNPDGAAIELTNANVEGDYPCFTGDGQSVVFEYYDGDKQRLRRCNFTENFISDPIQNDLLLGNTQFTLTDMELPGDVMRPAGMKNMITNFTAVNTNGDEIKLTWNRYTENDIFYFIQIKEKKAEILTAEKKVFSQSGAVLQGLTMGMTYMVRVYIEENEEEVATSQWKEVKMPEVIARPSYEIDENNPYLVKLQAWKPEDSENSWEFEWLIDNTPISASYSQDYLYEFATSGTKTIALKASVSNESNVSSPMEINIVSDIEPVIEYVLAEDSSYIELSAENSRGNKIDFSSTLWTISGPGSNPVQVTGSNVIVQLDNFSHKINVNLALKRIMVNGQQTTDTIEKSMVIDLDLKEVVPVITYEADTIDPKLFKFSGEQSKGNIDWHMASWKLYADGEVIHQENSVSTMLYQFSEANTDKVYTVTLTVPRRNDGMTETVSQIVSVEATPIEPVMDYQILDLTEGENVVGAKLLLDCTKSTGSNIDFNNARWSVPVAGGYGEQPTQFGPTAIYNLMSVDQGLMIEVALTLNRRNGTDPITITRMINLTEGELPEAKMIVNENIEGNTNGIIVTLDVLKSTGPNIKWEQTEWLIDGNPYQNKGPVAKIELPASGEKTEVNYTCTLYRDGAQPETKTGKISLKENTIVPLISYKRLSETRKNVYELSVLDTQGINIDWERTDWYIFDGNENVIQKRGAKISHAFALTSEQQGYPVMAEMYFKDSSYPFVTYTTIDVEGDELLPIITYDQEGDDQNVITFSATTSKGSNIDWNQAKWTFGDSSESQYGTTVIHQYPLNEINKTFKVSLTLTRRSTNGDTEVKTVYKDIKIGKDEIKAVIKVLKKDGDYLVLSAEDSEGKGLILDRSNWLFEGEGDNSSYSEALRGGAVMKDSFSLDSNNYFKSDAGISFDAGVTISPTTIIANAGPVAITTSSGPFLNFKASSSTALGNSISDTAGKSVEVADYSNY